MRTLNLGILAHVDAGKTSLTERLLYAAGVIDEVGSVDAGSTRTDTLALERQRGITIKSAVVSFLVGDTTVNLIDTPGHPDFIAEVERVLDVLDGAVLVVSAVEGVQAQTRVLMRALRRLRIPTLLFVNKLDRAGAQPDRVLAEIAAKLSPAAVPMVATTAPGGRAAAAVAFGPGDDGFESRLADVLADHDDDLLAAYVHDAAAVPYRRLRRDLAVQTGRALVHPVYLGSAITGAGVNALMAGITELLPAAGGDPSGPVSGTVFKVERGPAGEKLTWVRMFGGTLRIRDRVRLGDGREGKITAIRVVDPTGDGSASSVGPGRIATLWGLGDVRIGDVIGVPREGARTGKRFAPPTLETVVVPRLPLQRGALQVALAQLAEQDPLIALRQDDLRREISVSLYGEVQKEVIEATLAGDYGLEVDFRESTTICVERLTGTGSAVQRIRQDGNPFLAGVGLRVEPAPPGGGVRFGIEIELGSLPPAFLRAIEETVRESLGQGLHGWEIPDCQVTLWHSGYAPRQSHAHAVFDKSMSSTAGDFRLLTPLVLVDALRAAGTRVHEPWHRLRLEIPADTLGQVLPALTRLRAVPGAPAPAGAGGEAYLLTGDIPAATVHQLHQELPALTRGEGVLETEFARYQPVTGAVPERPRTDHNPLDRKEYLLHVVRRV
ncbi:elongation factor G [Jiangella gansuensis]|uniref:elongation factor G n=1 Tax=Jiangella gansuensis TaxID=281473 RepID=UPI00047E69BC|nr:TetM/TetW/TetO/TetS family tetracycline resistance ribosomal protection protein [Jiangella gansuensis]